MSRREQNRTDESTATDLSITDSLKALVLHTWGAAGLYLFGDEEQQTSAPEVILRRMLSTKSAISTKSSLAEENERARDDVSQQHFTMIGKGQCGSVYALKGTTMAIKLPNTSSKTDELFRELKNHMVVHKTFKAVYSSSSSAIRVPKMMCWVTPESNSFWSEKAALFQDRGQVPNYGLVSERIYPLPRPVREALVSALCPKQIVNFKDEFLRKPQNKDCLVRLYLGRRHDNRTSNPKSISMRNFPLHADEMERIGLETKAFALAMAEALALLHWKAGLDANDVEFVLGSTPALTGNPSCEDVSATDKDSAGNLWQLDLEHRTISVWLLDFNECKAFKHDASGLKQLVRGFWFNDPYYPRPNSTVAKDKATWEMFACHYLKISNELVAGNPGPGLFIEGVVAEGKKRGGIALFG
jgi:hypothetical protein